MKNTLIAAGIVAFAVTATAANTTVNADNTKRNEALQKTGAATADAQSSAPADLELTRKIRTEVVSMKHMSMNGKNVKIISNAGRVTLRGPVSTMAEKHEIEEAAKRIAGASNVDTFIEVIAK